MGNLVEAKVIHQGNPFVQFTGEVVGELPNLPEYEHNEWWIKYLRSVDMTPGKYDFPPHIVRVKSTYGTSFMEELKGDIILRESPLDPITKYLPMEEQVSSYLWTPIFLGREITLEDQLDGDNTLRDNDTPKTWEASMEGLKDIPGIGKTTMKKIQNYFENIDN